MKIKKVNRYYCEYCKKANCSSASINKHEKRCTKNPNRVCGMCKLIEQEQPIIEIMLELLPDPKQLVKQTNHYGMICEDWNLVEIKLIQVFPLLRERSGNCPACILSALRQKGIPVSMAESAKLFCFTEECKQIFKELNQQEDENY